MESEVNNKRNITLKCTISGASAGLFSVYTIDTIKKVILKDQL